MAHDNAYKLRLKFVEEQVLNPNTVLSVDGLLVCYSASGVGKSCPLTSALFVKEFSQCMAGCVQPTTIALIRLDSQPLAIRESDCK